MLFNIVHCQYPCHLLFSFNSRIEACTVFGAVRLHSRSEPSEGIVEFCDGFHWGRVCADGWDANDAAVVCKELGYTADGESKISYMHIPSLATCTLLLKLCRV